MKTIKNIFIVALLLFAVIHISFTLIYVLPANFSNSTLKNQSKKYIAPLFDQSWGLFAPVPQVNKTVYVNYRDKNGNWCGWQEPFANYLYSHQSNRLSSDEKIVYAISNDLHYLYNENYSELQEKKSIAGNPSSGYFKVMVHAVKNELKLQGIEILKIKLLIVFKTAECEKPKTFSIYYPEFELAE